jgi:hypothetical protein
MRGDGDGCEVCTGTLGPGAQENVCRDRIAELLGYAPARSARSCGACARGAS